MEKGGRKKNHKVVITATASGIQARQNWKFDSKCLRETFGDKGWIFFLFSKMPAKTYFGRYHWDSLALLPEGIFYFCFVFLFLFQKKLGEWLCTWKNCEWEWRDLRNKTNQQQQMAEMENGFTLPSSTQLWVEVEALGK